jgi:RHS repeat-associated protein
MAGAAWKPTSATSTEHLHRDHLSSMNAVTDLGGTLAQTLTYHPYGEEYQTTGNSITDKHYISERYDPDQDIQYLNARYYEGSRGEFLSQDPVHWELGQTRDGLIALYNPQLQNSYAYAGGNPVMGRDPSGRWALLAAPLSEATLIAFEYFGYAMAGVGAYNLYNIVKYPDGYEVAEIDEGSNRVIKDALSIGIGYLFPTVGAGMSTFDAIYETGSYYTGKVQNKVNEIKNSPPTPTTNTYQTTPSGAPSGGPPEVSTPPPAYISSPRRGSSSSSSKKSSNLNTATSYYNKAKNAYDRGEYKTAKRYAEKANKALKKK